MNDAVCEIYCRDLLFFGEAYPHTLSVRILHSRQLCQRVSQSAAFFNQLYYCARSGTCEEAKEVENLHNNIYYILMNNHSLNSGTEWIYVYIANLNISYNMGLLWCLWPWLCCVNVWNYNPINKSIASLYRWHSYVPQFKIV